MAIGYIRDRRLQAFEVAVDRMQETLARLGERQLAGAAVEQPHSQVALQHGHVAADRRRRQRQLSSRGREAAGLRTSDERLQVDQRFHERTFNDCSTSDSTHCRLIDRAITAAICRHSPTYREIPCLPTSMLRWPARPPWSPAVPAPSARPSPSAWPPTARPWQSRTAPRPTRPERSSRPSRAPVAVQLAIHADAGNPEAVRAAVAKTRRNLRQHRYPGQQRRHRARRPDRRNHVRGLRAHDRGQRYRRVRRHPGSRASHDRRRSHHPDRQLDDPLCGVPDRFAVHPDQGRRDRLQPQPRPRPGPAWNHGQHRAPRSDRHRHESRRWPGFPDRRPRHGHRPLRQAGRNRQCGRVPCQPGCLASSPVPT